MGVEGLYKFINKRCSEIYRNVSIYDIKDKSCVIDGMQHIYTQLIYMRSKGKEIITSDGKNISHIHGLINSLTYYLKNGIIPIFIFDGKSPDIKKKKIEERKQTLKQNLKKLKELETMKNDIVSTINTIKTESDQEYIFHADNFMDNPDNVDSIILGTPPEFLTLSEEIQKMQDVQEEYKKIYKKSIVLKDYFIIDWMQILELLGLPVLKATGEADPLCAYIVKNNPHVYGIISDDSDMLVFGAPRLMRKSINQQFTVIELDELVFSINKLLLSDKNYLSFKIKEFKKDNLIEFSLLLGTDYALFKLREEISDSYELLIQYMSKSIEELLFESDIEKFYQIKKYYTDLDFDESFDNMLKKPVWKKPKLLELKYRLLELNVDEDYIDKNNELFDNYYSKYLKKITFYDNFNFRKKMEQEKNLFDNNFVSKYNFRKPPTHPNKKPYYEPVSHLYDKPLSNPIPILNNSKGKPKKKSTFYINEDEDDDTTTDTSSSSSDNDNYKPKSKVHDVHF
jgi:flap endonuclease-1